MSDRQHVHRMINAFDAAAQAIEKCPPDERRRIIAALSEFFRGEGAFSQAPANPPGCVDCGARLYGLGHVRCSVCNKKHSLRTGDFNEWRLNESSRAPTPNDEPGDG